VLAGRSRQVLGRDALQHELQVDDVTPLAKLLADLFEVARG